MLFRVLCFGGRLDDNPFVIFMSHAMLAIQYDTGSYPAYTTTFKNLNDRALYDLSFSLKI